MNLMNNKKPRNPLTGQSFGRLLVADVAGYTFPPCGRSEWFYLCSCSCGNTKIISAQNLRSGDSKSCGCLQREHGQAVNLKHGMSYSETYNSWAAMRQRCGNENHEAFKNYGGRGISMCSNWNTFEGFLADMQERPAGTTLDRIDTNGNYEPSNCKWATFAQQASNRRNSLRVIYRGKSLGFIEALHMANLNVATAKSRFHRGWDIGRIIEGAQWENETREKT